MKAGSKESGRPDPKARLIIMLPPAPARAPRDTDAAVRSTDSDAAQARLSAISKGYLSDQFAHHLVPRARFATPRPPLINHGTHVRATALDALVDEWLAAGGVDVKKQIISVGAGSDSRFWRISVSVQGRLEVRMLMQICRRDL